MVARGIATEALEEQEQKEWRALIKEVYGAKADFDVVGRGIPGIIEEMEAAGPGATGIIYVERNRKAHMLNVWVNDRGRAVFIETQYGAKVYDPQYLAGRWDHFELLITSRR